MRAMAAVLLGLVLSAGAAPLAVAGNEFEEIPWKEGDVIRAKLLGWNTLRKGFVQGVFQTADGVMVCIVLDPDRKCTVNVTCEDMTPEEVVAHIGPAPGDHIRNVAWIGRWMFITFKQWNSLLGATEDDRPVYAITASGVRLDDNLEASPAPPRHP